MKSNRFLLSAAILSMMTVSCTKDNQGTGNSGKDEPGKEETDALVLPTDPKPSNVNFSKKTLIVDFTGTGCMYCPNMTKLLKNVLGNTAYSQKTVLAIAHMFDGYSQTFPDPAYFSQPPLNRAMEVKSFPWLVMDLNPARKFTDYTAGSTALQQAIDIVFMSNPVQAGICAASKIEGDKLTVKVGVKSKVESPTLFGVGVWVLEDGLRASQNGANGDETFFKHDNCVRAITGNISNTNFSGKKFETKITSGQTADMTFSIDLDKDWKKENLKYLVFVTAPAENGNHYVNNVAVAKIGSSITYQYE